MLGIIIGIASIISIVSTIKGTSEQIKENLIGAGNNAVTVSLYEEIWNMTLSMAVRLADSNFDGWAEGRDHGFRGCRGRFLLL